LASFDSLICLPVSVLLFTFAPVTAPFLSRFVPTLFARQHDGRIARAAERDDHREAGHDHRGGGARRASMRTTPLFVISPLL